MGRSVFITSESSTGYGRRRKPSPTWISRHPPPPTCPSRTFWSSLHFPDVRDVPTREQDSRLTLPSVDPPRRPSRKFGLPWVPSLRPIKVFTGAPRSVQPPSVTKPHSRGGVRGRRRALGHGSSYPRPPRPGVMYQHRPRGYIKSPLVLEVEGPG